MEINRGKTVERLAPDRTGGRPEHGGPATRVGDQVPASQPTIVHTGRYLISPSMNRATPVMRESSMYDIPVKNVELNNYALITIDGVIVDAYNSKKEAIRDMRAQDHEFSEERIVISLTKETLLRLRNNNAMEDVEI